MTQKNETEVKKTGHIYDGIEELDHAPPNWFTALFYVTILCGGIYYFHYTLGEGHSIVREYEDAYNADEYARYEHAAKTGGPKRLSEQELLALAKDTARKTRGAAAFQSKCASCHGAQAQGGIGPNLTDRYWLHGGKMTDVLLTIDKGVPDNGMPPWGPILSADELHGLTVYIQSVAGTRPAGAKEAQGTLE
jgi:cytochrome c oxidase cbb3-type subunit 3